MLADGLHLSTIGILIPYTSKNIRHVQRNSKIGLRDKPHFSHSIPPIGHRVLAWCRLFNSQFRDRSGTKQGHPERQQGFRRWTVGSLVGYTTRRTL